MRPTMATHVGFGMMRSGGNALITQLADSAKSLDLPQRHMR